jgi:hypothetical protein
MGSTTIRVIIDGKGSVSGLETVNKGLRGIQDQAAKTQLAVSKAYQINFSASSFNSVSQNVVKAMQGVTKLNPAFINLSKTAEASGKSVTDVFNGINRSVGNLQAVLAGGIIGTAVVRGLSAAVDKSVELENALIGVDTVAKSFGQSSTDVRKAVLDFTKDGLVPATDAALAFKQILSTGTDLPTAIKLMDSLKNSAAFNRQAFYTLGEAIVATTEGIKNGNSVRADAVGITTNLSVMDKQYAALQGTVAEKLSDRAKYEARVLGFIKEGEKFQGDAAKLLDTYSGSVSRLGTAFDRALAKIGNFITQSETVKLSIKSVTQVLDAIGENEASPEQRIASVRQQLAFLNKEKVGDSSYRRALTQELALLEQEVNNNQRINEAITSRRKKLIDAKNAEQDLAKAAGDTAKKQADALKSLEKKYQLGGGLSDLQKLTATKDKELKIAGKNADLRLAIEKEYTKKVDELNQKKFDKELERQNRLDRINKKIFDALTTGAESPFKSVRTPVGLDEKQEYAFKQRASLGRGVGLLNNVVGGADGAKKLISGIAGAGLDKLIPGLGQAAQPLLEAFTQGPAATRAMVKQFAAAIPEVVEGFIKAAPAFAEELANQTPVIIERLAEKAPDIILALVKATPRVAFAMVTMMPKVALKFMSELIKNIPRVISEIARAVYEGIKKVLQKLTGTGSNGLLGGSAGGGGINGALKTGPTNNGTVNLGLNVLTFGSSGGATTVYKSLKKKLGFAHGGEVMSVGAPFQDSINAKVQTGEFWVDRSTTKKLKKQLDDGGMGGNQVLLDELKKITLLLSQPQTVTTEAKINNDAFAKIILNLNRTNQRLSV